MKAVLRGKFIALSASIKKLESCPISNLKIQLKVLEIRETSTQKGSRRMEIIKIMAEINQIETKKQYKESAKPRTGSLRKIKKTDKPLAKLTKR